MSLETLQQMLGYRFADQDLLQQAMTHRSWAVENPDRDGRVLDNERLEFLGDAVLELLITETLMDRFPDSNEGALSRLRAFLVRTETLARVARRIELGPYLRLGVGEAQSGGHDRDRVLSDALEALIGALYRDGGLAACANLLPLGWGPELAKIRDPDRDAKDPKSALQERTQKSFGVLPRYAAPTHEGPPHARLYRVRVEVLDDRRALIVEAEGEGSSKQNAQRAAARRALDRLDAAEE